MRKTKWAIIIYLIIAIVIMGGTIYFIPLCSPFLPHPLICVLVIVLFFTSTFFYIKSLLSITSIWGEAKGFISFCIGILLIVTISNYAAIYTAFYYYDHNLFTVAGHEPLSFWDFCYFSISTLATVGYGDIVAKSTSLRMIVSLEIIHGIALLVFGISNLEFIKRKFNRE